MVFSFREPEGMRKLFKRKQDVTLTVLEPIYGDNGVVQERVRIETLKNKVYEAMEKAVKEKGECESIAR